MRNNCLLPIIGNNLGNFAFKTADNTGNYLKIIPNPAQNNLDIAALPQGNSGNISLYSTDGRLLQSVRLNDRGETNIDLGAFGNGIYILNLRVNDGTTINQKLVIAR